MALASSNKTLSISCRPLKASMSIVVSNSVTDRQTYSATDKTFTPDYTLTPLSITPICNAVDADNPSQQKRVNESLVNVKWYEIINGERTLITTGNDYVITANGENNGQILVKKNSSILSPITLEFRGDYLDKRTNQVLKFVMSHVIIVSDESSPTCILNLDTDTSVNWNPLRDISKQTITASLFLGKKNVTADARAKFYWYRLSETGVKTPITDGNGEEDWEIVSINKNVLTIDRDFIGESQSYVCIGVFSPNGSKTPNDLDPNAVFTIKRRFPSLHCEIEGTMQGLAPDTTNIFPKAIIYDTKGIIPNPEECLEIIWLVKNPKEADYKEVARGIKPTIPFTQGMMLRLDVEDKGANKIVVDDNDSNVFITDEDGSFIFSK